jgi:hypothetical protein
MIESHPWTDSLRSALLDGDRACLPGGLPAACPEGVRAFTELPEGDRRLAQAAVELLGQPVALHRDTGPLVSAVVLLRCGLAGVLCPEATTVGTRMLGQATDPATKALLMLGLAAHDRDRLAHADYAELVTGAISLLPDQAPVGAVHLHQAAMHLALRGLLRLLVGHLDLPQPGDAEPAIADALLAECLYDAVANGRSAQARHLLAKCREASHHLDWQRSLIDFHAGYAEIMAAIQEGIPLPPPRSVPSGPLLHALVAKDMDFLSAYAAGPGSGDLPLIAYDGLRAALSVRDAATARRLHDERQAASPAHPLDDLFLFRLLLLEDRPREAAQAADRLVAAGDRFDAWGRIDMELRLSLELSGGDLLRLGRGGAASRPAAGLPQRVVLDGPSPAAIALRERIEDALASAVTHILVTGPSDGTRTAVAELLHARLGLPQFHRLSAADETSASLLERMRGHMGGTVFVDDIHRADAGVVAGLATLLAGPPGRAGALILGGTPGIEAMGESWSMLAWSVDARLAVPPWSERSLDAGTIIPALVRSARPGLLWTDAARRALARRRWSGWPELQAWARAICRQRTEGLVDGMLLARVAGLLDAPEADR